MRSNKCSQSELLKMTGRVHENIGNVWGKQNNDSIARRKSNLEKSRPMR
jgi:hypothetical protein